MGESHRLRFVVHSNPFAVCARHLHINERLLAVDFNGKTFLKRIAAVMQIVWAMLIISKTVFDSLNFRLLPADIRTALCSVRTVRTNLSKFEGFLTEAQVEESLG